jgi:hypothetical protein
MGTELATLQEQSLGSEVFWRLDTDLASHWEQILNCGVSSALSVFEVVNLFEQSLGCDNFPSSWEQSLGSDNFPSSWEQSLGSNNFPSFWEQSLGSDTSFESLTAMNDS